jgi:hypothetical protein
VLPQTIAIGHIHSGTMTGKLNGVMPAVTPSGWNSLQLSIAGPDVAAVLALEQFGRIAGVLDVLDAALQLAERVVSTLPCSAVISRAICVGVLLEQLA